MGASPMEKICRTKSALSFAAVLFLIALGCSTKEIMEDNDPKFSNIDEEYSKVVSVSDIEKEKKPVKADKGAAKPVSTPKDGSAKGAAAKDTVAKEVSDAKPDGYSVTSTQSKPSQAPVQKAALSRMSPTSKGPREPAIEDSEGFAGRRPIVDPYTPGEKVVLTATYLNIQAGDISFEVLPFKNVNDRKAYHLRLKIISSKTFNMFYAVNNTAETYLDYETMLPQTLTYDGKESSRIREYRTFFDWAKMEAFQWRREVLKTKGEKKKKLAWPILPYTQNILSAVYYLRAFKLEVGKTYSFRVADEGKNYVFAAHVLRREKLKTDLGEFNTLVIRPDYKIDGKFTPAGANTIWVTDDARKLPVRVEAKVKIGSFVAKLKSIEGVK